MALANQSGDFGRLPAPCPRCGARRLHQSTTPPDPAGKVIVVRRCAGCGSEWHDGRLIPPRRSA